MQRDRYISLYHIVKRTLSNFSANEGSLRAAALAYYSVFALPPLLIVVSIAAGLIWSPTGAETALEAQFTKLAGGGGARLVHGIITSTYYNGWLATVTGIVGVFLGATGAFLSLQSALNRVWCVTPDPSQGGVRGFIKKRLLSFGMVVAVAFVLAGSLALTTAVSAIGQRLGGAGGIVDLSNSLMNIIVLGGLFATMFKVLPDAEVAWRDVWLGGLVTAVLLDVGKTVMGIYLGTSHPGNPFGAASALAVVFIWVYYVGTLVLLGAEFTQQYAMAHGRAVRPERRAVKVRREEHVVDRR